MDRPSFKELQTIVSRYIEQIAGYLELGFNPFSGEEGTILQKIEPEEVNEEPVEMPVVVTGEPGMETALQ